MFKSLWSAGKLALRQAGHDNVPRLAAALAFYTMLSSAPLLVISVKVAGGVFGREAASGQIVKGVGRFVGREEAQAVQGMIVHAAKPGSAVMAVIASAAILLFSAGSMFAELHDALNTIWGVRPNKGGVVWQIVRERFFAFLIVLGAPALLLASLAANTTLSFLDRAVGDHSGMLRWHVINAVVSTLVVGGILALGFKYLPDVRVSWRPVWRGAVLGSLLITAGNSMLGWYLARASGVYGAAGSLAAMLIWVYYSAQIFFFAAEFTTAYAHLIGETGTMAGS